MEIFSYIRSNSVGSCRCSWWQELLCRCKKKSIISKVVVIRNKMQIKIMFARIDIRCKWWYNYIIEMRKERRYDNQ